MLKTHYCKFCGWKGDNPKVTWLPVCPTCEVEVEESTSSESNKDGTDDKKTMLCDNRDCQEMIEVPADYKPEYCCNGHMCGCYGYPTNPMFCDKCEKEILGTPVVEITCYNCDGEGWQMFMDNGCPNQETCEVCKGRKKIFVSKEMADGLEKEIGKPSLEVNAS